MESFCSIKWGKKGICSNNYNEQKPGFGEQEEQEAIQWQDIEQCPIIALNQILLMNRLTRLITLCTSPLGLRFA
jgi:hypothetical protein